MKKLLFNPFALVILFASCSKEKIVIQQVPVVHSWSQVPSLTGLNAISLTSVPLNDSQIAVANNNLITYLNINQFTPANGAYIFGYSTGYYAYDYAVRPSITKNIGVSVFLPTLLYIYATLNPQNQPDGGFSFTPSYPGPDSLVVNMPAPTAFNNAGYPVVADRYVLAPVGTIYNGALAANKHIYGLINFHTSSTLWLNQLSVLYDTVKYIALTPAPGTNGFANGGYFSASFFNKFFVYDNSQFYRIDTLGNIKQFGYGPVQGVKGGVGQMFTINGLLFTLNYGIFCVSTDQGETWSEFYDGSQSGSIYGSLYYYNTADGDLYGVYQGQLVHVTLANNTFTFTEVKDDGLESTQITSVNKCGKYAFVTTVNGVYYENVDSLNVAKK